MRVEKNQESKAKKKTLSKYCEMLQKKRKTRKQYI